VVTSVPGNIVFVGRADWSVGDATVNERSQARDITMKKVTNKKDFFINELYIVTLLSCPIIANKNEKLPGLWESFFCPNG